MEEIFPAIITVSLVVLILSLGIILAIVNYKRKQEIYLREKKTMQEDFQKELLKSRVEVQEATLSVLARELHDNVCQLLSSSKMLLGVAQMNPSPVNKTIKTADDTIGIAINELRALSRSLDKEWLERFDLVENLSNEVGRINMAQIIKANFSYTGKLAMVAEQQIILFRIIQEALQNAIKHACAKNIVVEVVSGSQNISVLICDDGIGINNTLEDGFGIQNMKQRTKLLGGEIRWESGHPGSIIKIELPINEEK